ncbi:MAG TPA: NYN domain-containing protein [Peptococcaceae bacterium]|nr:NYN domain-containing protein [Peptococcaceae bacterium]
MLQQQDRFLFLRFCARGCWRRSSAGEDEAVEGILLVDGYNVINSWPELSELKEQDIAHARDLLVAYLSEFQALCGIQVIVVYDAHFVKRGVVQSENSHGVEMIYTKEGETADNWIERYAAQHQRSGLVKEDRLPLFVSTYDGMEQRIIAAQGAHRVTPGELREDIQNLKTSGASLLSKRADERVLLDHHLSDKTKEVLEKWRRRKCSDC